MNRKKRNQKSALITGITGQDGSYLAEFLLGKGYRVFGMVRRSSSMSRVRIDEIRLAAPQASSRLQLVYGDMSDAASIQRILRVTRPDEVYNLASQSHVKVSFDMPEYTSDVTGMGALRLLEGILSCGLKSRFYQASSSEMFGRARTSPQNEKTPFEPVSPYGISKLFAHWITVNYRESRGLHASNGILFNHESPRRGENFVTRKITIAAARIKLGLQTTLVLGNLDAKRDWGYAPDYVEAMWRMLQQPKPDDYVVATGETHSVREFLEEAFGHLGLSVKRHVRVDDRYHRPVDIPQLQGDWSKARKELGWRPKVKFSELVRVMVDADLKALRKTINKQL